MIWAALIVGVVLGAVLLVLAGLFAGDPEGRGTGLAMLLGLAGVPVLGVSALGLVAYGLYRLIWT
jgi:hypothetical protein